MGLLGVFRSVYNVEGLKMNIKFEVEVLCKNLSIKLEDIPLRNQILAQRVAPIKERNPDFNIKTVSTQKPAGVGSRSIVTSPEAQSLGIALEVLAADALMPRALEIARSFCGASSAALSMTKQAINASLHSDLNAILDYECSGQAIAATSDYLKEAARRFVAKEPAQFSWPARKA